MSLLLILLAVLLIIVALLFVVKSKVHLVFDSAEKNINLTLSWLYPLLKSVIVKEQDGLMLEVYLFNKRITAINLSHRQSALGNKNVFRSFSPTDIHVNARFGFRDPFVTGLACSAMTLIAGLFNVESLEQKPDFLAINDYISLNASARLNLGQSLLKLI